MPWCDGCSRFYNPNSMPAEGTCPSCGRTIAPPQGAVRAPWHFWLMIGAVVVYLGWRLIQGLGWVVARF